jgi:hypothetical protein
MNTQGQAEESTSNSIVDVLLQAAAMLAVLSGWSKEDLVERLHLALIKARSDLRLSVDQLAARLSVTPRTIRGWRERLASKPARRLGLEILLRIAGKDVDGARASDAVIVKELASLQQCSFVQVRDGRRAVSATVLAAVGYHREALARIVSMLEIENPALGNRGPGSAETREESRPRQP